jgi:hypothetical protein
MFGAPHRQFSACGWDFEETAGTGVKPNRRGLVMRLPLWLFLVLASVGLVLKLADAVKNRDRFKDKD